MLLRPRGPWSGTWRARFILTVLLTLVAERRAEASALACGGALVLPGATTTEVLRKCGAPRERLGRDGRARSTAHESKRGSAKRSGGAASEVWVYEQGAGRLVRYLTFERGRLRSIQEGGYSR